MNNYPFPRSLGLFAWGVTIALFLATLLLRIEMISFHTIDLGGIESNVVYGIQKVLAGKPLYTDPSAPPFDIIQYSPLYYYVVGYTGGLLNIDYTDPQPVFVLSRISSLVFNLFSLGAIFLLCRHYRISTLLSAIICVTALASYPEHYYSRVDSLHILLFLLGCLLILRFSRAEGTRAVLFLLLAAVTTLACIFTKQSGILLAGIIGAYLLLTKQVKALMVFSLSIAGMALLLFLLTPPDERYTFYQNVIVGLKNGYTVETVKALFTNKYYLQLMPWFVGGICFAVALYRGARLKDTLFLPLAIILSFLFALITGLKQGSNINYYQEFFLLSFIAAGAWLAASARASMLKIAAVYGLLLYASALKTGQLFSAIHISHYRKDNRELYSSEKEIAQLIKKKLEPGANEYVFIAHRSFLEHFLFGKSVMNQKDIMGCIYEFAPGSLDFDVFFNDMKNGRIRFVITPQNPNELTYLDHRFQGYEHLMDYNNVSVYEWRPSD